MQRQVEARIGWKPIRALLFLDSGVGSGVSDATQDGAGTANQAGSEKHEGAWLGGDRGVRGRCWLPGVRRELNRNEGEGGDADAGCLKLQCGVRLSRPGRTKGGLAINAAGPCNRKLRVTRTGARSMPKARASFRGVFCRADFVHARACGERERNYHASAVGQSDLGERLPSSGDRRTPLAAGTMPVCESRCRPARSRPRFLWATMPLFP